MNIFFKFITYLLYLTLSVILQQQGRAQVPGNCEITSIQTGLQSPCNPATNTYSQEIIVYFNNAPADGLITINEQTIGVETTNNGLSFRDSYDGQLAEVKIFDAALSTPQINELEMGNSTAAANLVTHYPFREGTGTSIEDIAGTNDGEAFGMGPADWINSVPSAVSKINSAILTVTDLSGNVSTCAATITVEDNEAPTAICQPATVALSAIDGTGSLTANDVDYKGE